MQFTVDNFFAPIRATTQNRLAALQRDTAGEETPVYNALAAGGGPTREAANMLARTAESPEGRAQMLNEADKLDGVDPKLATLFRELAKRGAPKFGISEGMRSLDRQKQMVAQGKSQTMNSRHLHGNAVDIHLLGPDGKPDWTFDRYRDFYENHVNPLAQEMGVPITWGGNWKTLKDGVHFQLG
ncbi:M15 family metallopeptidase [Oceaniglobus trochenteri]|uniref:M15 family metallopeptidase n=1 Tax=Oceaniglobus trochenteri TaxID=2763260 RepID=UPI001CFF9154|nr:M15 family metallopeptidase [Oceaniglobus trochenteri]